MVEKLAALRLTRAAELVGAAVEETLTYYAFPEEHWRRIRTNNPLERILREIRRRTRVRIPTIVTTRSDGSRPPVPIDRDQCDGAVRCIC